MGPRTLDYVARQYHTSVWREEENYHVLIYWEQPNPTMPLLLEDVELPENESSTMPLGFPITLQHTGDPVLHEFEDRWIMGVTCLATLQLAIAARTTNKDTRGS